MVNAAVPVVVAWLERFRHDDDNSKNTHPQAREVGPKTGLVVVKRPEWMATE